MTDGKDTKREGLSGLRKQLQMQQSHTEGLAFQTIFARSGGQVTVIEKMAEEGSNTGCPGQWQGKAVQLI